MWVRGFGRVSYYARWLPHLPRHPSPVRTLHTAAAVVATQSLACCLSATLALLPVRTLYATQQPATQYVDMWRSLRYSPLRSVNVKWQCCVNWCGTHTRQRIVARGWHRTWHRREYWHSVIQCWDKCLIRLYTVVDVYVAPIVLPRG